MEEIYVNVDRLKQSGSGTEGVTKVTQRPLNGSSNQSSSRRLNKRRRCCGLVFLGLLTVSLLTGTGFAVIRVLNLSGVRQNLTELLEISNLHISSLTEERNQLNASLTKMSEYIARLKNVCPSGWKKLENDSCYFISDQRGSWDEGREDCKQRGADLVVIESSEEMNFLAKNINSWIGLNDREQEGTWKWVNGAPLTFTLWEKNQPDNWKGNSKYPEEDCVHISHCFQWNDSPCMRSQRWICEINVTEIFANGLQI
ncbi:C-type lectin domain family 10 member A-like [Salarias fasciatus]|uniref:C-type lectin domain family 10 member A-like n=1 Tax=Salarias fasciatus TaxID=181472 RepID=UPI001176E6EE|nr:C-type lectin domain family 10 member A-like [Salarias fasciatus]